METAKNQSVNPVPGNSFKEKCRFRPPPKNSPSGIADRNAGNRVETIIIQIMAASLDTLEKCNLSRLTIRLQSYFVFGAGYISACVVVVLLPADGHMLLLLLQTIALKIVCVLASFFRRMPRNSVVV